MVQVVQMLVGGGPKWGLCCIQTVVHLTRIEHAANVYIACPGFYLHA